MNKSKKEFSNEDLLQRAEGDNGVSCRNVVKPRSPTRESAEPNPQIEYTETELNNVNRILNSKNFYEILGVSKNASVAEIIKAYKKIAVHIHPDKNHAPGATEAFKRVGNAVEILRDTKKRQLYDARESKEAGGMSYEDHVRGFEANLPAEEVFMMFVGALGAAVGGYAGYKLAGAISSNRETGDGEENAVSPKANKVETWLTLAGAAIGIFAGIGLMMNMKPKQ